MAQQSHYWVYTLRKPQDCKTHETCSPTFTAEIFTTARMWKQPRCPMTDKCIKKMYIHTMEYYSAIKRNKFESVVVKWMNLEPVIQTEVNQKKKNKYISTCIWNLEQWY